MTAPTITFAQVREAARGRWQQILPTLGIRAEALTGRHGPCPGCGGHDRFRFDDREGRGTWICGGGGDPVSGDGFALLVHCAGLSKLDALRAVADHLGVRGDAGSAAKLAQIRSDRERDEIERATWHELRVLLGYVQLRCIERDLAKNQRFREARPEWRPFPPESWERELLAARRLKAGLARLYP